MPRPERPLDPDAGVVQRFAWELRELRRRAGNLGYRELARRAHYSASALAQAARGEVLPSLAVALAYVRACGADASDWEVRWRTAADEVDAALGIRTGCDEPVRGRAPYVGMAAFQVADSAWFFGRDRLVAELVARVEQRRFVGVFGPSGSGKSSLLRAGLIPALAERPVAVFTPGTQPLDECAVHLARLTGGSAVSVCAELAADPANLHLLVRQAMAERPADEDLILIVDQFEEIFTLCSDHEQRRWFIEAMVAAAAATNSQTRVVVGVRADFYGHCAHHANLVDALRDAQVMVGPMSPDQLRQAITGPAARAGCRVETALVSRLVADATGQPAVLPLVSHALLQTWHRRHGTMLTLAAYEHVGGIAHALAKTAEITYGSLDAHQQDLARRLFQRLTALGDGTEDTRRRISHDELDPEDPNTMIVLDTLADARLITLDHDSIQLAHEALIRHWPRLRDWLTDDRDSLRIHRQLTEATHAWQALDRDPGALYRGTRLARTNEWINVTGRSGLTGPEYAFLEASRAVQTAEQATAQRHSRRLYQLIGLLAVLLLLAAGTAGYAVNEQTTARQQRNQAVINEAVNRIATLASTEYYPNRELALSLSLAAYRLDPNPRTRGSLISTYAASDLDGVMAFAPDGRTMVKVHMSVSIELFEMTQPNHPQLVATSPSIGDTSRPISVLFTPDGNTLVITARDDSGYVTILFDIEHRRHLATLPGMPIGSHPLTPDSHTLALFRDPADEIVRLIDITDPQHPNEVATIGGNAGGVTAAAFSLDGHTLVTTGGPVSQPRIWNIANPRQPALMAALPGDAGSVRDVTFNSDGNLIIMISQNIIRIWDITDPRQPSEMPFLGTYTGSTQQPAVVSPDGHTLAALGPDGRIVLRDITDPRNLKEIATLAGSTDAAPYFAVFGPDSHLLATFSTNNTVQLWDIGNSHQPIETAVLTHDTGPVVAATFSPDGQILAATINEHFLYARLWEMNADRIATEACANPELHTITQAEWNRFFPGIPRQSQCY